MRSLTTNPLFEGLSNLPPISEAFITTSSSASASDTDSSLDIELISQLRGSRAIREEDIEAQQESGTASFDAESLAQYHALVSKGKIESIGISPSAQEAEEAVEKYLESYWESKTSLASLSGLEQKEEGGEGEQADDTNPINRFVTIRSSDGLFNKGSEVEIDEETSVEDSRDQLGSLWDASSPLRSPFSSLPQYLGSAEKIDGHCRERREANTDDSDDSSPLRSSSPTEVRRNLLAFSSESPTQNYEQVNEEQVQRSRKPPSSKRAPIVSSRISGSGGVRVLGPFDDNSDDISSPLERVAHNLLHLLIDEGPVVGAGGPVADDLDASGSYPRVDDKSNALLLSSLPQGSSPLDPIIAKVGDKKTTELLTSTSLAFDPVFASLRTPDARADYSRLIRKGRLIDEAHSDPKPLQQTPL